MVFLVQQVELNKQSGRRSEKQKVKINKMEQRRMQKETESVQRHVNAVKAEVKFVCRHLRFKSSSLLFSFPGRCAYTTPAPSCVYSPGRIKAMEQRKKEAAVATWEVAVSLSCEWEAHHFL